MPTNPEKWRNDKRKKIMQDIQVIDRQVQKNDWSTATGTLWKSKKYSMNTLISTSHRSHKKIKKTALASRKIVARLSSLTEKLKRLTPWYPMIHLS